MVGTGTALLHGSARSTCLPPRPRSMRAVAQERPIAYAAIPESQDSRAPGGDPRPGAQPARGSATPGASSAPRSAPRPGQAWASADVDDRDDTRRDSGLRPPHGSGARRPGVSAGLAAGSPGTGVGAEVLADACRRRAGCRISADPQSAEATAETPEATPAGAWCARSRGVRCEDCWLARVASRSRAPTRRRAPPVRDGCGLDNGVAKKGKKSAISLDTMQKNVYSSERQNDSIAWNPLWRGAQRCLQPNS